MNSVTWNVSFYISEYRDSKLTLTKIERPIANKFECLYAYRIITSKVSGSKLVITLKLECWSKLDHMYEYTHISDDICFFSPPFSRLNSGIDVDLSSLWSSSLAPGKKLNTSLHKSLSGWSKQLERYFGPYERQTSTKFGSHFSQSSGPNGFRVQCELLSHSFFLSLPLSRSLSVCVNYRWLGASINHHYEFP